MKAVPVAVSVETFVNVPEILWAKETEARRISSLASILTFTISFLLTEESLIESVKKDGGVISPIPVGRPGDPGHRDCPHRQSRYCRPDTAPASGTNPCRYATAATVHG